jgi:hypothetical protein
MKDYRIEQFLKEEGMKWKYHEAFQISKVRFEIGNVRGTGQTANDTNLELIRDAIRGQTKLPPIIIYPNGKRYGMIDGNHRALVFLEEKISHCAAYEVDDPDDIAITRLQAKSNLKLNGKDTHENRLPLAMQCVQRGAHTVKEAAAVFKISEATIKTHMDALEMRKCLTEIKFDFKRKNISDNVLPAMKRIKTKAFFHSAANVIADGVYNKEEARRLCMKLDRAADDSEAAEIIAKETRAIKSHRSPAATAPKLSSLRGALTKIFNIRREIKTLEKQIKSVKWSFREEVAQEIDVCFEALNEIKESVLPKSKARS